MFVIYCVQWDTGIYGSIKLQLTWTVFLPLLNVGYMTCILSSGVVDYMIPQEPVSTEKYTKSNIPRPSGHSNYQKAQNCASQTDLQ